MQIITCEFVFLLLRRLMNDDDVGGSGAGAGACVVLVTIIADELITSFCLVACLLDLLDLSFFFLPLYYNK